MSDNPHETSARLAKATKLADIIQATRMRSEEIERGIVEHPDLVAEMWLAVAQEAGVPKPSETTQKLVLELLKAREKAFNVYSGEGLFPKAEQK